MNRHDDEWRKSSYSSSGNCVEAASFRGGIKVRDTKNRDGYVLRFKAATWQCFTRELKNTR